VSRALRERNAIEVLVHTGQHFDTNMSDIFFDELDIPVPKHHLGIGGGSHGQNTGRMIEAIERVLQDECPDWVLLYGDTDSTLAGALAAVKLHIPVAHVEAGLRSFNRQMPEEINRILTDHASDLLFAPTETAVRNLGNEGISGKSVRLVGDVMYDAALYYGEKAERGSSILGNYSLSSRNYVLVTLHRQENVDDRERLGRILKGLSDTSRQIVWPMHPRTRKRIESFGFSLPANVRVIDPVGYLDMVMLEKHANVIATDSGGVQKEAYFHGVPCVTLREETEWVELIEIGANVLVGADTGRIAASLGSRVSSDLSQSIPLYGRGDAGITIAAALSGTTDRE